MEELINLQELNNDNITHYLEVFNNLTDEEIVSFFDNEKGNSEIKSKLIEIAENRINKLPTPIFIEVSTWASNPVSYLNNYLERIEKMTYEEFVDLLFNGIYEPDIAIELAKKNIYKQHLLKEKEEQKENNLQCFDIDRRLATANDIIETLNIVGQEIIALKMLNSIQSSKKSENIELLENTYLNRIIENIDEMNIEEKSIKNGLGLIELHLQNQELITPKMIEFYLQYRVKELNLKSFCEDIIVTLGNNKRPAFYTLEGDINKNGTLKIYYEYVIKVLQKYKGQMEEKKWNDIVNINFLPLFSHELKHVCQMDDWKRITKNKENEEFADIILTNPIANFYFREVLLKECIGEEGYDKNHDTCIKEAQADIFSYFDTNNQLLTNFKNCYPESLLANIVSSFAKRIVEFYTDKDGNMLSPMEKFNMFYLEIMGENAIPIIPTEYTDILTSLMNGDKIPEDVFEFMKKIANQEIRTTDLYTTLNTYLQNRRENRNDEEENLNLSNPTL